MMLMMAPVLWVIMVYTVRPVDWSSRSPKIDRNTPTVRMQQIWE